MMNKSKSIKIILSVVVLILIIPIAGVSYLYLTRKPVDVFSCIDVEFSKIDGAGQMKIKKKTDNDLCKKLYQLNYEYDENSQLSNNDSVVIKIKDTPFLFLKNKIKPLAETKTYQVSGLVTIPKTWTDVPQKETIESINETEKGALEANVLQILNDNMQEEFKGKLTPIISNTKHLETWYGDLKADDDTCPQENKPASNNQCGTVIFVYEIEIDALEPEYYYPENILYGAITVTGIYVDEAGNVHGVANEYNKYHSANNLDKIHELTAKEQLEQVI